MTTDLISHIEEMLVALGDNPEAVADNLLMADAFGRRGSCTSCPIARYLEAAGLGIDRVNAVGRSIIVYAGGAFYIVDTPPAVARFMGRFDVGHFDALLEPVGGEVR